MHAVEITYKPSTCDTEYFVETIHFSSEKNARDFTDRMKKLPTIESAHYLGEKK